MVSKPFFTEKDFTDYKYHEHERPSHAFARMCNEKLEKALGPVVKSFDKKIWGISEADHPADNYQARLFDVREIVRERECEHPVEHIVRNTAYTFHCCECDKDLKAKWEVADEEN